MIPDPRSSRSVSRSASTRRSTRLDREFPERLLRAIADEHGLHVYVAATLEGSDAYGFVLSREPLDERELQQIEAWHWQEPFGEVYRSDLSR